MLEARLRGSGWLLLITAGALAAVALVNRFAPAFVDLARGAAAIVVILVAAALFRRFRSRGEEERRLDERRDDERRETS